MNMRIDEPRQQGFAMAIDNAQAGRDRNARANSNDPSPLHHHIGVRYGLVTIEHPYIPDSKAVARSVRSTGAEENDGNKGRHTHGATSEPNGFAYIDQVVKRANSSPRTFA